MDTATRISHSRSELMISTAGFYLTFNIVLGALLYALLANVKTLMITHTTPSDSMLLLASALAAQIADTHCVLFNKDSTKYHIVISYAFTLID